MANEITGRPDHIEDALLKLHSGAWFGWSDSKNKIYANLIVHPKIWDETYEGNIVADGMIDNPHSKPTEKECTDKLAELQTAYDAQAYARNRAEEYPSIGDQLDMIYHNGDGGATFQAAIKAVKDKYPKP